MAEVVTAAQNEAEEARIRDAYARRTNDQQYSWFNPGHLFMTQERERRVLPLLARYGFSPLDDKRILDIGCGTGRWLREFVKWGARPEHITGVDLLPDRLSEAQLLCPPAVTLVSHNAASLPFADAAFDLVLQSTVFTSILDGEMRRAVAAEMTRVVRPGGLILWYDYHVNNPANPDVRGVKKPEILRLFPGCRVELRRVTLAPPLARALAPYSRLMCQALETIPWLKTHYLGVIRKDRS